MFGTKSCFLYVIPEFLRRPLAGSGTPCVCGLLFPTQDTSHMTLLGAKCPLSAAGPIVSLSQHWGNPVSPSCVWGHNSISTHRVLVHAELCLAWARSEGTATSCSDTTQGWAELQTAGAWQAWGHLGPATHTWALRGGFGVTPARLQDQWAAAFWGLSTTSNSAEQVHPWEQGLQGLWNVLQEGLLGAEPLVSRDFSDQWL